MIELLAVQPVMTLLTSRQASRRLVNAVITLALPLLILTRHFSSSTDQAFYLRCRASSGSRCSS